MLQEIAIKKYGQANMHANFLTIGLGIRPDEIRQWQLYVLFSDGDMVWMDEHQEPELVHETAAFLHETDQAVWQGLRQGYQVQVDFSREKTPRLQ
jgi:hypothetical protein